MVSLNESSLICNYNDGIFKFFFDSESNKLYLNENIPPEFVLVMDKILKKEYEVVYLKIMEKCPVCGSDLNKNGTDGFWLNKSREIRKQKYVCTDKNCEKHTRVWLNKFIDKYCNYTKSLREFSLNTSIIGYLSYEKKVDFIEWITGVKIPRSTVYYHENTLSDEIFSQKRERNRKKY
jgi:hypothetical protein